MTPAVIRKATAADIPALHALEAANFSKVANASALGGFLFADTNTAEMMLNEAVAEPLRMFVSVAEFEREVVGFAFAIFSSLPGTGQPDPRNMVLQYLAVDPSQRRQGVGRALVEHIVTRVTPLRQDVILAHVPAAEAEFYRRCGWEVLPAEAGFGWLPFNDFLRADFPDPEIGYEHVAALILRPRALRRSFAFTRVTDAPTADAMLVIEALIDSGELDPRDLDGGTLSMLRISRGSRDRRAWEVNKR